MSVQIDDLELLNTVRDFALAHTHPAVQKFRDSMQNWGDDWITVEPNYLPAADFLGEAIANSDQQTRALVETFERHKSRLHWEQSYKKEDEVVPDAMLEGYAFAEIIGKRGPFVSDQIRAGIGVWGPDILYPRHRHQAEEIYIVVAGAAEFKLGAAEKARRSAGDVVYVESNTPHGFRTTDQNLVVYYLWQAGDLRQTSSFE
jgi:mannose-6-phosphate isomerase-like protein (cupin superfamily)